MTVGRVSGWVIIQILFAFCVVASPKGVLTPEQTTVAEASLPLRATPSAFEELLGKPEYVNDQYSSNIVVWRYVAGDQFFLVAFNNGRLAASKWVPRDGSAVSPPQQAPAQEETPDIEPHEVADGMSPGEVSSIKGKPEYTIRSVVVESPRRVTHFAASAAEKRDDQSTLETALPGFVAFVLPSPVARRAKTMMKED